MPDIADAGSRGNLAGEVPVRVIRRDGTEESTEQNLLHEQVLQICVGGRETVRLVCTRSNLRELVMGRLLTEGIVSRAEDVVSVEINESGEKALVQLESCAGGSAGRTADPDQIRPSLIAERKIRREWIFHLAETFAREQPLYAATHSVHSCILSRAGRILFSCEDIGRHNAMDKAIGYALLHDISLSECEVYTSGRVPVDMVDKAVLAGIPVLVSKALPTQEAVKIAASCDMMIIGRARVDSFRIFCGGDHLI